MSIAILMHWQLCLPAGTVSGAPKIRAMEIINKLEKSKRGLYSGAIGYLSANGNMDFALAIRTMILKENMPISRQVQELSMTPIRNQSMKKP